MKGCDVNGEIIEKYDGTGIELGKRKRRLREDVLGGMKKVEGDRLMIRDGSCLLGGEDKGGVVEIMEGLK
ncbi:hypothetical protein [Staphylococcus saprophyticus]|uniref:hypothetical protein n=1 Tax=Staphylococcus saprophyticus TaxID=29385 RepID=UPI0012476D4F|nr:hypothetical protein [Staphylococcus saprophyticus]